MLHLSASFLHYTLAQCPSEEIYRNFSEQAPAAMPFHFLSSLISIIKLWSVGLLDIFSVQFGYRPETFGDIRGPHGMKPTEIDDIWHPPLNLGLLFHSFLPYCYEMWDNS